MGVYLRLGFYVPRGYIIDEKQSVFTRFTIDLRYIIYGKNYSYNNNLEGKWCVGEYAEVSIPLGMNINEEIKLNFSIFATLKANRPYKYKDDISFKFHEQVKFKAQNNKVLKYSKKLG